MRSYCGYSEALTRAGHVAPGVVADLQHDLRALGYLAEGVTGVWSLTLDRAVRALRHDLVHTDRKAGVGAYNPRGAVTQGGMGDPAGVEPALAGAVAAMMDDPDFPKLPASAHPLADNLLAWEAVRSIREAEAPGPFMAAIFEQDSEGRHYQVPSPGNRDSFVTVALGHDDPTAPDRITSRAYGIGRFVVSHHPPTAAEVAAFIIDPAGNARAAFALLRAKYDRELVSPDPPSRAEHRRAEWPVSALRGCQYARTDPRYQADCKACALAAGTVNIVPGRPVYPGATLTWRATARYPSASYQGVPDRTGFPCDWPYAVRLYHGVGIDSYHYETRVLIHLAHLA